MGVKKEDFKTLLISRIYNIQGNYIDLVSGDIHRELGGYPGKDHRMPSCCSVMRELMNDNDEVLSSPTKGNGATLTIRYYRRG